MKPDSRDPEFRFSQAVYARLLAAYPRAHRADYGAAMTQLFRDQCRDAWKESRSWGLLKLWLRILPDLASTSILERLAALKERKTMTEKLANLFAFRITPASTFFRVFVPVFLLVFGISVVITFILPESYASTARVLVESDAPPNPQAVAYDPYFIQTTFEIMQSQLVLNPVVDKLDLNVAWGKKYFAGQTLKTTESAEILRQRLQLAPVKNTKLIAITVYSDDKVEAAQIANAVAQSYLDYRLQTRRDLQAKTMAILQQESREQEIQIQTAQANLDALHAKFGILDNVEEVNRQMVLANNSLREMEVQLSELRSFGHDMKRNAMPSIVADATLPALLGQLQDAEQKFVTLTNDYALSTIQVTRVTSLISELNRQIDERIDGITAGLETKVAATKAASEELAAAVQKSKVNPENQAYWDAKRDLEMSTESHKLLIGKIEQEQLEAQLPKPVPAQIVDLAEPGSAPVRPNKPVNIILGAFLGIFLASASGGAFALLSFISNRRLRTAPAAA
jgi:uncharacterized protein involved in exopolysaccharide biosynthesis